MPAKNYISESVIRRLPRYYRFLGELQKEGLKKISSGELSNRMKLTASQIRQDLNCFGGFGQQGYGYNVTVLREEIGAIIGVERKLRTIIIGAGNLARAIITYFDFERYGCELMNVFDIDERLVGTNIAYVRVTHASELETFCKAHKPEIAALCIPEEAAAQTAQTLVSCGIKAFWNFSHCDINLHIEGIVTENVHLGDSLLTLAYNVNNRKYSSLTSK